jgi:hypothetical protein
MESNFQMPAGTVWLVQVDPPFVVASMIAGIELFPAVPTV